MNSSPYSFAQTRARSRGSRLVWRWRRLLVFAFLINRTSLYSYSIRIGNSAGRFTGCSLERESTAFIGSGNGIIPRSKMVNLYAVRSNFPVAASCCMIDLHGIKPQKMMQVLFRNLMPVGMNFRVYVHSTFLLLIGHMRCIVLQSELPQSGWIASLPW